MFDSSVRIDLTLDQMGQLEARHAPDPSILLRLLFPRELIPKHT